MSRQQKLIIYNSNGQDSLYVMYTSVFLFGVIYVLFIESILFFNVDLSGLQVSLDQMKSQDKTEETLSAQFNSMQDNLTSILQVELESQMLRVIQR